MYLKFLIFFIFYSFLLFAKEPIWISNPYKTYDKNIYEVGVGSGNTEKEAENNAYSVLANIFGMKISVDTKANEKYLESISGVEETRTLDNTTRVEAEHNLINVKIDSKYYDKERGLYYAVAIMHKKDTAKLLEKKIKENINIINEYLYKFNNTYDLLDKYSILYLAYVVSEKNENFISQLSIIDNSRNINVPDSTRLESLKYSLDNLKKSISFSIDSVDITPNIESAIEHSINTLGFKISSNPSYVFKDKFTFDGNDTGYGMYIVNYVLILELINKDGDRIASFKFRGKDGGSSEKDAIRVVMNKISKEVNSSLSYQISDFLDQRLKNK